MSGVKKILLILLMAFVAIQFIRPARNEDGQDLATDFRKVLIVPEQIQLLMQNACYDCHSNHTAYPWYANIQPMGWLMADHIKKGKAALNLSDFGSKSKRRQISKLKQMANQIKEDEMPLYSYKLMHKKANLTKDEKNLIITWMNNTADSLATTD
ncbi:MAG: cytochrome [Ferruginibacter sp.]|nr:cytochrome [Ferruginibacter sp.]